MLRSLGLVVLCSAVASAVSSPPVQVSLRTSWPAPPLLNEIIETAAQAQPEKFFEIASLLAPLGILDLLPEHVYNSALNILQLNSHLGSDFDTKVFELEMAMHKMNPMVVAHYQAHEGVESKDGCDDWIEWGEERLCDIERLKELVRAREWPSVPKLLPLDHVHDPDPSSDLPTILHHACLSSDLFSPAHMYLAALPHLKYVLRWAPPSGIPSGPTYLSGWGVALDLKKTEYSSIDDRLAGRAGTTESKDDSSEEEYSDEILQTIRTIASGGQTAGQQSVVVDTPETEASDQEADAEGNAEAEPASSVLSIRDLLRIDQKTPLSNSEYAELPLNIIRVIMASSTPLQTLSHISSSYPFYAPIIARALPPSGPLMYEPTITPGLSAIWLNGATVSSSDFNALSLPSVLRKELKLIDSLAELGFKPSDASAILANSSLPGSTGEETVAEGRVDIREVEGEEGVILWWNNISKDSRYNRWPRTLGGLLRQVYPGQFHSVARNLYNVVMRIDLSHPESLNFVVGYMSQMVQRGAPVRFGFVGGGGPEGKQLSRLVNYVVETYGRSKAMTFISELLYDDSLVVGGQVSLPRTKKRFDAFVSTLEPKEGKETKLWDEVLAVEDDAGSRWANRLGLEGHEEGAFVNGRWFPFGDDFLRQLQVELSRCLQHLQEEVYLGRIDDGEDMDTYFYRLPGTMKRRNRFIQPSVERPFKAQDLKQAFRETGWVSPWIVPAGSDNVPISLWIVSDFCQPKSQNMMREALEAMSTTTLFRLSFIPSGSAGDQALPCKLPELLNQLALAGDHPSLSAEDALTILSEAGDGEGRDGEEQAVLSADGLEVSENLQAWLQSGEATARRFGIERGRTGLIINGRVIAGIEPHDFLAPDFEAVTNLEYRKRVAPVTEGVQRLIDEGALNLDRASLADLVAFTSSITSAAQTSDPSAQLVNSGSAQRSMYYSDLTRRYSRFQIGDWSTAIFRFGVIIDPISDAAQKWGSVLTWLASLHSVHIEVVLNPRVDAVSTFVKTYYGSVMPFSLSFDGEGQESQPQVVFEGLPPESIYTLAMDTHNAWVVRPRESPYDLDNIFLASLPASARSAGVQAVFELQYLVIGGHAREGGDLPPRGAEVQITKLGGTEPVDDTMIVANLGYLQLKAQPGVYRLELRPGRTSEVFEIETVGNDGWNSKPVNETDLHITVSSFEGLTLFPRLKRKPGMEHADVLKVTPTKSWGGSLLDSVTSFFGSKKTHPSTSLSESVQADINIFTVASGLLYERFAFIMTVSVMRHTNSTVKFWFIENFLSPSFLEIIPHVAEEYGFQYELVTYKWPTWLRAQKEKQREIWAYKILFLDVLFPMDLKKVIFVDADQIVRTDLKELVDLDLHGAPYGYTPMGDDREDMDGFRFWKTGYWLEALRGKPYHISALYVIDLLRFRQLAAGDRLRQQYQALSADPNSLANLDQDLPNNMQHEIPIYSLDKDWLWCETWCSKDRLETAKTIDLCQNPLTKEPKLVRARQIPEWEVYDAEIAALTRRLAKEGKIHWSAAMADSDALANVGSASAVLEDVGMEVEVHADQEAHEAPRESMSQEDEEAHIRDEL